jgi:hypothetical protein
VIVVACTVALVVAFQFSPAQDKAFLTLEAIDEKDSDKYQWHVSLARMSSLKHTVHLDEEEIWSIPGFYTIPAGERKTGPYVEAFQGTFTSELPPAMP